MVAGMKASPDCIPCLLGQVLSMVRRVSDDEWLHVRILKRVMAEMAGTDLARSPAEVSFDALRAAGRLLGFRGGADPYAEDRKRDNALVKELLPGLRKRVAESSDPVTLAAKFAIAGNVVGLGALAGAAAMTEIERAAETKLAVDDTAAFREAARSARSVFYVLDNAGEAVLDRLLIEVLTKQLKRKQVTCLVRQTPVLNGALRADAVDAGLEGISEIRDPGAPMLGLVLNLAEPTIQERFAEADLVIAKGQDSFETLCGADREVFFLLRAKCRLVAEALGIGTVAAHEGQVPSTRIAHSNGALLSAGPLEAGCLEGQVPSNGSYRSWTSKWGGASGVPPPAAALFHHEPD